MIDCPTLAATEAVAEGLADRLTNGGIVLLRGQLGAGKTAFTRGLVRGLGGDERQVSSPTYVLAQAYDLPGGRRVWHLDLYRLSGPGDLEAIGFDEILASADEGDVVVIEWPKRADDVLPNDVIDVRFERVSETGRRIRIA